MRLPVFLVVLYIDIVSIHASVKDATKGGCPSSIIKGFNPRICKRCDQKKPTAKGLL